MHLVIYIFVTFQVICNLCFKSSLYFCYISGHLYSVLQVISTWFYFRSSAFCASSHLYFVLFQVICNPCFKSSILCYISGHLHFVLLVIYTWLYFNSLRSVLLVIYTLLYFRSSVLCSSSHLYFVLFQVLCFLCFWSYEYCYTVFQAICKLDDDAKILGSYPLDDGHRIHVEDNTK